MMTLIYMKIKLGGNDIRRRGKKTNLNVLRTRVNMKKAQDTQQSE